MRRLVLFSFLLSFAPTIASAQPPTARERLERAIARYETALETTDESRRHAELEAALAELDEANRLEPSPLIDWNLGLVENELGHPVEALGHVERFVAAIPTTHARRAEAEALLATLRTRVASVWVDCELAGATIVIDGDRRGSTPIAEWLRVPAGEVVVEISAAGYRTMTARIRVAGETSTHVPCTMEREATALGQLHVEATLAGLSISVDGEARGTTPLDASIALTPGTHVVRATRVGYLPFERVVDIAIGAEMTLAITMTIAEDAPMGRLVLHLPDARASLSVDGAAVLIGPSIALPIGPHELALDVEERLPWTGTVEVTADGAAELTPDLEFDPASSSRLRTAAETQRIVGVVTAVTGAAAVVTSIVLLGLGLGDSGPAAARARDELAACRAVPMSCPLGREMNLEDDASILQTISEIEIGVGTALGVAGAVALGIGVWAYLDAPSDEDIASRARARLRIGPASLAIEGSF